MAGKFIIAGLHDPSAAEGGYPLDSPHAEMIWIAMRDDLCDTEIGNLLSLLEILSGPVSRSHRSKKENLFNEARLIALAGVEPWLEDQFKRFSESTSPGEEYEPFSDDDYAMEAALGTFIECVQKVMEEEALTCSPVSCTEKEADKPEENG